MPPYYSLNLTRPERERTCAETVITFEPLAKTLPWKITVCSSQTDWIWEEFLGDATGATVSTVLERKSGLSFLASLSRGPPEGWNAGRPFSNTHPRFLLHFPHLFALCIHTYIMCMRAYTYIYLLSIAQNRWADLCRACCARSKQCPSHSVCTKNVASDDVKQHPSTQDNEHMIRKEWAEIDTRHSPVWHCSQRTTLPLYAHLPRGKSIGEEGQRMSTAYACRSAPSFS